MITLPLATLAIIYRPSVPFLRPNGGARLLGRPTLLSQTDSEPDSLARLQASCQAVKGIKDVEARRRSIALPGGTRIVSGVNSPEPSFTRLFTSDTWRYYTGRPPLTRWYSCLVTWRFSTVLSNVLPLCAALAVFAFLVASLPSVLWPRINPYPLSLQGTAIGLLLVFRTNNSYQRLSEARELWGRAIVLCREIAQGMTIGHKPDGPDAGGVSPSALCTCRLLCAFGWSLATRLSPGGEPETLPAIESGDAVSLPPEVLLELLPPDEASWVAAQRSRPLALLGRIRRVLVTELGSGRLHPAVYYKLEEDLRELDHVVGSCERLYCSPLPPTMTRHLVRCLLLWLGALPLCLVGTMGRLTIAAWVGITACTGCHARTSALLPRPTLCLAATPGPHLGPCNRPMPPVARPTALPATHEVDRLSARCRHLRRHRGRGVSSGAALRDRADGEAGRDYTAQRCRGRRSRHRGHLPRLIPSADPVGGSRWRIPLVEAQGNTALGTSSATLRARLCISGMPTGE